MKCFAAAALMIFADQKWWCKDKQDIDWGMFLPTITKWNKKCTALITPYLLILDESMVGWKPKTSKTGGLPNALYEPQKPVNYGTMPRDSADCCTGIIMNIDPVMYPEQQANKPYGTMLNPMPDATSGHILPVHGAKVLRQVENSRIPANGWTGGDAWFGLVASAVILKKKWQIESTWVVKNHLKLFLQAVLFEILRS